MTLKRVKNYLCERNHTVTINNFLSKKIVVHSGLSQGSHLGTLLFLIFLNETHCFIFADDVNIFSIVSFLEIKFK